MIYNIRIIFIFILFLGTISCSPDENINNDQDDDKIVNTEDNCPETPNEDQLDTDEDGMGDLCDDDDDNDGITDAEDNCPLIANPEQEDMNNDGKGDACDSDIDNDGIPNETDNCPNTENPDQKDNDNDGIGDVCDEDDDNDGVIDTEDNCPNTLNPNQEDQNNDGIGDFCSPTNKVPCENGMANGFPCNDYDLLLNMPLNSFFADAGNDSWGWTDPINNKEYALMGLNNGTAFIDITDTDYPVYLGKLPTATANSSWRDIKVYKNHAFIVSEAANHGMQVFDLTRLRNVTGSPTNYTADKNFTEFGSAHNIVINEDSGYAYIVGASRSSTYGGGPIFVNIQDPLNPIIEGGFAAGGYSHDAQVITYTGPDTDYTDKEILIGSNENEIVIADVTDKTNPLVISTISYSNVEYAHQGWFTEDLKYFILGDELDEQSYGNNTRTIVFDFTDLDNPLYHFDYFGFTAAIDHNGYVKDNIYYQANYTAGVRMVDVSNTENKVFSEVGFFDTYPNNNNAAFNGVWNVYPYFPSGKIIISDIDNGFFVIKKSNP
jgi:choice-of-anchor B domain-containing protein